MFIKFREGKGKKDENEVKPAAWAQAMAGAPGKTLGVRARDRRTWS